MYIFILIRVRQMTLICNYNERNCIVKWIVRQSSFVDANKECAWGYLLKDKRVMRVLTSKMRVRISEWCVYSHQSCVYARTLENICKSLSYLFCAWAYSCSLFLPRIVHVSLPVSLCILHALSTWLHTWVPYFTRIKRVGLILYTF